MTLHERYTHYMHGNCIKHLADQHNKLTKTHMITIGSLQDTIADLQSDINRLNKEILFTQEGYERELLSLRNQLKKDTP